VLGAGVLLLTGAAWWLRTSPSPAPAPLAAAPAEPPPRVVAPPMPTPMPVPTAAAPLPPAARVQPPAAPTPAARASAPPLRMALDADASRAAATLPRLKDLPEALRHELPALRVGGTMYSDSPGASVLVINDQLLREGDSVVPGLLLERIGPKSARLRWKDQRFELPY
jgi:general secretion pathway protein B